MWRLVNGLVSSGLLLSLLCLRHVSYSTHIRAGEIIARRVSNSSLTYEFTIIGYTDTRSTVVFAGGEVDFGDGTIIPILEDEVFFQETIDIGDEIAVNTFKIEHTFQAPGVYTIRYREFNRNAGIVNMDNSVDTPFYVETQIRIDPSAGLNNTPVLLAPPVDKGAVGARYIHNPAAFDPDGDSLSYHVVIPRQDVDIEVANYRFPNAPEFYQDFQNGREDVPGPPIFRVDSITGDVIWDAPGAIGEYNFAFIIREWRQFGGEWRTLGYVTRDMQVIIEESDNQRPVIAAPPDLCIEAGTFVSEFIQASDPDGHPVRMEAFGGPFELSSSPAMYSPN
ncbi:MAG: gliding motility-associated C-terminal domain-containing protein, partial [Bacteroidota bacterium]